MDNFQSSSGIVKIQYTETTVKIFGIKTSINTNIPLAGKLVVLFSIDSGQIFSDTYTNSNGYFEFLFNLEDIALGLYQIRFYGTEKIIPGKFIPNTEYPKGDWETISIVSTNNASANSIVTRNISSIVELTDTDWKYLSQQYGDLQITIKTPIFFKRFKNIKLNITATNGSADLQQTYNELLTLENESSLSLTEIINLKNCSLDNNLEYAVKYNNYIIHFKTIEKDSSNNIIKELTWVGSTELNAILQALYLSGALSIIIEGVIISEI